MNYDNRLMEMDKNYSFLLLRLCIGCSDHASFTNYGFPAAFPAEVVFHVRLKKISFMESLHNIIHFEQSQYNLSFNHFMQPQMHSEQDSFENVGFTQVMEFIKLSVAFAVEVAEPSN